ncbi:hypothetical protein HPB47_007445 [Ixodes persulcatus]|uniref:Uncharacterized protein n=1 Tax=Ixodes persulcatus TaxID=34615 RepID=A0AC60P7J8_IXOPE|nr:hypothetical protein HPB47_007445 [Ixodes persulcatus]
MARIKTECNHLEEMIALLEAAEDAQNGAEMWKDEVSLQREGPQKRKASELTGNSDGACPLVTENDKMKSKGGFCGDSELHLKPGAEAEASALARGEDAEVMMRPMVVLKKAQQSTGSAKVMTSRCFVALVLVLLVCAEAVTIDKDGGYENVIVAIGKDVTYQKDIIVNLKALFRKASAFLLAATKGKFYFKEVIISVPSSWPPMGSKKVWEDLFNQADVQVASGLKEPDTLNPSRSFPEDFNPVQLPFEFVRT